MEENQPLLDLEIDNEVSANLTEVSRWSKLLGIVILTGIGLVLLLFIVLWNRIGDLFALGNDVPDSAVSIAKIMILIAFLVAGAIVGVLISFLIKGAVRIREGIRNKDQITFNSGLANLKNYFVMYGILGLLGLFFSLLGLLFR